MSKLNPLRTLGVLCVSCGGVLLLTKFSLEVIAVAGSKRLLSVANVEGITARDAADAEGAQRVRPGFSSLRISESVAYPVAKLSGQTYPSTHA